MKLTDVDESDDRFRCVRLDEIEEGAKIAYWIFKAMRLVPF